MVKRLLEPFIQRRGNYGPLDEFSVTIKGRGGHGAKPHETIDPIVIMAEFILSAQKIISRTII